jgi:DNA-binding transcriptional MerR regulator
MAAWASGLVCPTLIPLKIILDTPAIIFIITLNVINNQGTKCGCMDMIETYGKKAVVALTGLTYRQIDHWATTGVVVPIKAGKGKGSRREYSFKDLVALRMAKKLVADGISLQKIRKALGWLRKQEEFKDLRQPLAELRFVTDGETLFVTDLDKDRERIMDALKQGQLVFSVSVKEIIEDLRGAVKQLAALKASKVRVRNQSFSVALTPDFEAGGYTVQCKEIPAAISQGETEQEAIDNIIEVLEEHFEYVKEQEAGKAKAV